MDRHTSATSELSQTALARFFPEGTWDIDRIRNSPRSESNALSNKELLKKLKRYLGSRTVKATVNRRARAAMPAVHAAPGIPAVIQEVDQDGNIIVQAVPEVPAIEARLAQPARLESYMREDILMHNFMTRDAHEAMNLEWRTCSSIISSAHNAVNNFLEVLDDESPMHFALVKITEDHPTDSSVLWRTMELFQDRIGDTDHEEYEYLMERLKALVLTSSGNGRQWLTIYESYVDRIDILQPKLAHDLTPGSCLQKQRCRSAIQRVVSSTSDPVLSRMRQEMQVRTATEMTLQGILNAGEGVIAHALEWGDKLGPVTVQETASAAQEGKASSTTCWNCDGDHTFRQCKAPKNEMKIKANAKKFHDAKAAKDGSNSGNSSRRTNNGNSGSRGQSSNKTKTELSCYNCGKKGHYKRDCKQKLFEGNCENCGKKGHRTKFCKGKKKEDVESAAASKEKETKEKDTISKSRKMRIRAIAAAIEANEEDGSESGSDLAFAVTEYFTDDESDGDDASDADYEDMPELEVVARLAPSTSASDEDMPILVPFDSDWSDDSEDSEGFELYSRAPHLFDSTTFYEAAGPDSTRVDSPRKHQTTYQMDSFQLNGGIDIGHRTAGARIIPDLESLQIVIEASYRLWDAETMGECPGRDVYKKFIQTRVQKAKMEKQFMDFSTRCGLRGLILSEDGCALEEVMTCALRACGGLGIIDRNIKTQVFRLVETASYELLKGIYLQATDNNIDFDCHEILSTDESFSDGDQDGSDTDDEINMLQDGDGESPALAAFVGDNAEGKLSNTAVDSAATSFFSGYKKDFGKRSFIDSSLPVVYTANKQALTDKLMEHKRTVFHDEAGNKNELVLPLRYLNIGKRRLLGVHPITEAGAMVSMSDTGGIFTFKNGPAISFKRHGKLWKTKISLHEVEHDYAADLHDGDKGSGNKTIKRRRGKHSRQKGSLRYWHAVLKHANKDQIIATINSSLGGEITSRKWNELCTACAMGKGRRTTVPHEVKNKFLTICEAAGLDPTQVDSPELAEEFEKTFRRHVKRKSKGTGNENDKYDLFEMVSTDLFGPIHGWYYNVFIDHHSRYSMLYQMASKNEAYKTVVQYSQFVQQLGHRIRTIKHDPSGEQMGAEWKTTLMSLGIQDLPIQARSQWQNGVAERQVATITDGARTMMAHAMLTKRFTGEALRESNDIYNIMAQKGLNNISPHERVYNVQPNIADRRVFGSEAMLIKPHSLLKGGSEYTGKMTYKAVQALILGLSPTGRGWRIERSDNQRKLNSNDCMIIDLSKPRHRPLKFLRNSGEVKKPKENNSTFKLNSAIDRQDEIGEFEVVDRHARNIQGRIIDLEDNDLQEDMNLDAPTTQQVIQADLEPEIVPAAQVIQAAPDPVAQAFVPRQSTRRNRGVPGSRYGATDHAAGVMEKAYIMKEGAEVDVLYVILEDEFTLLETKDLDEAQHIIQTDWNTGKIVQVLMVDNGGEHACATTMSYDEAIKNNPNQEDKAAMKDAANQEFYGNLIKRGAIKYVTEDEVPADAIPLQMMWTFVWKIDPVTGKRYKAKARLVLRGDKAIPGVHHEVGGTYSPTPAMITTMIMLSMSVRPGVETLKADVSSAFTLGTPSRIVYCTSPQGFVKMDGNNRKMFIAILANLYGSVEAARRWLMLAMKQFILMKFKVSLWDPCLMRLCMKIEEVPAYLKEQHYEKFDMEFVKEREEKDEAEFVAALAQMDDSNEALGTMHHGDEIPELKPFDFSKLIGNDPDNETEGYVWLTAIIHVDDVGMTSNHHGLLLGVRDKFLRKYPGTSVFQPEDLLGLHIKRVREGHVNISQHVLAQKMIKDCKQETANSRPIPLSKLADMSKRPSTEPEKRQVLAVMDNFPSVNGSLGYVVNTRPELGMSYNQMSRVASNPGKEHVKQLQQVCRYVKGTLLHGIDFKYEKDNRLVIYCDTSFGDEVYTGIVVRYNGGPIAAKCMRQKTKKTSTFVAEFVGVSEAVRWAIYATQLIKDTGQRVEGPALILNDNMSTITVANQKDFHTSKIRHYRIRLQWVRERIEQGDVIIRYVPSADNIADLLTKQIDLPTWRKLAPQLRGEVPLAAAELIQQYYQDYDEVKDG